MTKNKNTEI